MSRFPTIGQIAIDQEVSVGGGHTQDAELSEGSGADDGGENGEYASYHGEENAVDVLIDVLEAFLDSVEPIRHLRC